MMNKKGDVFSIILLIVFLFIIGIILLFSNKLNNELYSSLDEYFNDSTKYNNSEAQEAIVDIQNVENSVWDYAFLFIALGYVLALALLSYSTRISPVFYWIYGLVALVGLLLGVIASNIWQEAAANPEFVENIARFPIMDTLLGSYYPLFITVVIIISMILLFGKPPGAIQE